jgi:hypothetical protein
MTDLSPAAQAVMDAYKNAPDLMLDGDPDEVEQRLGLAAALRAVAVYCTRERRILLTIAAELEGGND